MHMFQNKGQRTQAEPNKLDNLLQGLRSISNEHSGNGFGSKANARLSLATESLSEAQAEQMDRDTDQLSAALEGLMGSLMSSGSKKAKTGDLPRITEMQKQAALAAGIMAGDVQGFLNHVPPVAQASEFTKVIAPQGNQYVESRMKAALEAYDEKENKNAVVYSVAYNMQASRQDEFGETFFPTVVVTPDQVGYQVSVRLIQVMPDVKRDVSGTVTDFGRRNILKAVRDYTILRNDQTDAVPYFRTESASNFVSPTLVATQNVMVGDESVPTGPLAVGKKIDLLGISQNEATLATGQEGVTDALDTNIVLKAIYIQLGTGSSAEVLKFNTSKLPYAVLSASPQQGYRRMILDFQNNSLLVNGNTKDADGSDSTILAPVGAGNYQVKLGISVSGSVDTQLGDTTVYGNAVTVEKVLDASGTELDKTTGNGKTIADLFATATMIGYDLDARRTNSDRRQRGKLLDTTYYNQIYTVPLLSPITVPRPMGSGSETDSSDLNALITATHIMTSNAAVTTLLQAEEFLSEFVVANENINDVPEVLGVARFLVTPFYDHQDLDVSDSINNISSHAKADDIAATIVNALRDQAYRMYRDSGYKAAADAMAGGMSEVPTIIIGTDQYLSRYLMVNGDLRTLGADFNVKIVSTQDLRMQGKIIMSFGVLDNSGVPNPMTFGNMAWKPELTVVLPIHRAGSNSKELTVQPSFLHIINLPILASLTVTGIPAVATTRTPVDFHTV